MATILVAEDDMVRELVIRTLNEDGHKLTAARDGAAALKALARQMATSASCSRT